MLQVFQLMLRIDGLINPNAKLLKLSCNHLLSTSAYIKGKYGPLLVIIEQCGSTLILQQAPKFIDSLVPCLALNHLAPVVSRVYRAVIRSLLSNHAEDVLCVWKAKIAPDLVNAIVSSNQVARKNILQYWVPVHLDLDRRIFALLVHSIASHKTIKGCEQKLDSVRLPCIIDIMKLARCKGIVRFEDMDKFFLRHGIKAADNHVRANAFLSICKTNKLSTLITNVEFLMIRENLPLNMNIDCASFRQDLVFCINFFIRRALCSLASSVKKV